MQRLRIFKVILDVMGIFFSSSGYSSIFWRKGRKRWLPKQDLFILRTLFPTTVEIRP